jgi:hypothetical protein
MRHRIAIAALATVMATAMIAGTVSAGTTETVNGVTILRGSPATAPGSAASGLGSGSSAPPSNTRAGIDQSGALNAVHTGSANAGGAFDNLPPNAGR